MACHGPACSRAGDLWCSKCKGAAYCSVACQRAGWPKHKIECAKIAAAKPIVVEFKDTPSVVDPRPPRGTLAAASAAGDLALVKRLCAAGHQVNAPSHALQPLSLAAAGGHTSVVRELIAQGASVNASDAGGSTALVMAAKGKHLGAAVELCEAGAILDGPELRSAVCDAIAYSKRSGSLTRTVAIVAELLRRGAKADAAALHFACERGSLELVVLLCAHGADVRRDRLNGVSALQTASEHGPIELVRHLLSQGADAREAVRGGINRGYTALHFACSATLRTGNPEVVLALLQAGGSPNARSDTGSTPLWLACQNGHAAAVLVMCQNGGDGMAYTRGSSGQRYSCLDMAVQNDHEAVHDILLRFGFGSLVFPDG